MVTPGPLLTALYSISNVYDVDDNTTIIVTTTGSSSSSSSSIISTSSNVLTSVASTTTTTITTTTVTTTTANVHTTAAVESAPLHRIQPEEIIILGVIISMWVVAVLSFLRKWSRIRILQPVEPRYLHTPKNLENVRVVKRTQDSVIYKNYSRKMSVTMVARENMHLQRMPTLPLLRDLPLLPSIEMSDATPSD